MESVWPHHGGEGGRIAGMGELVNFKAPLPHPRERITTNTLHDGSTNAMKKSIALVGAATLAFGLAACDVDQTEEGEMPEVEGGNLPEYDVEPADVDVGTEETTVEVPTVDVEVEDAAGEPVTGDEE